VYQEAGSGGLFVGDAVGIAFPHGHLVQPVTPPPDFDPEGVATQLRRMADREPAFLGFAHFGPDHRPLESLAEADRRLWEWVRFVEAHPADASGAALREWVLAGYRQEGYGEEVLATYDDNTFWPMQAAGIMRWLAKRET
jgi:glyoxylase-like metal-dependent hydrolase (beta-lactamase superfamily II)